MKNKVISGRQTNIPDRYQLKKRQISDSCTLKPIPDEVYAFWKLFGLDDDYLVIDTLYKPTQDGYIVGCGRKPQMLRLLNELCPASL